MKIDMYSKKFIEDLIQSPCHRDLDEIKIQSEMKDKMIHLIGECFKRSDR